MRHRNAEPVFDCDQLEDELLAWRTGRYLTLGFNVTAAARLADTRIDGQPLD